MKVSDLIAELQGCDQDAEVHFAYNYSDHWRTEVAPKVDCVEMGTVKHSEYHRMPKVVQYDAEDDDAEYSTIDEYNAAMAQKNNVVILR